MSITQTRPGGRATGHTLAKVIDLGRRLQGTVTFTEKYKPQDLNRQNESVIDVLTAPSMSPM